MKNLIVLFVSVLVATLIQAADLPQPNRSSVSRVLGADPITGAPSFYQDIDLSGANACRIKDGASNAISSTVEGGARGLDTHQRNTGQVVSVGNSTTTPLAALASFNAGFAGENVLRYTDMTLNLAGSPSVAPGTLYFEFSPDGTNWDVSVPTVLTGPNALIPLPLRPVLPYFRVRYVNGATPLTTFRLTTVYHWQFSGDLTRVLNQSIDENEPVKNVRAFIGGKSPNGPYTNLPATGEVASQSTSTPLGANATFNTAGSIIEMGGYVAVGVTVLSDVNSATNGLVFHWYNDALGTIEIKSSTFTYGTAGMGTSVQVPQQGPYLRITYTNGAVAQSSFQMLARLFVTSPPSDVLAINETITGNTAAQIVKSHNVGLQENGVYANVGLSNIGSLKMALTDRTSEVRNRTFVDANIDFTALVASPGTLIHTVTAGKTFYLLDYVASCVNQANAIGRWYLADGTTRKIGIAMAQQAVGSASASSVASPTFLDPPRFTTSVRVIEATGDVSCYITIHGYEE